jgi:hypothetical protein
MDDYYDFGYGDDSKTTYDSGGDWWTPSTEGDQEFMDFMSGAAGDQEFNDFMAGAAGDQEFMDFMTKAYEADQSSGVGNFIKNAVSALGGGAKDFLKKFLYDPATGKINLAGLGTAAMGLYSMTRDKDSGGYNKPVPKMEMVREQIQYNDPNRRPGESGRQYFTDPQFSAQGDTAGAQAAADAQVAGIQAAYQSRPAAAPNPYTGKMNLAYSRPAASAQAPSQPAGLPQIPNQLNAQGGIGMAQGGVADAGRYLRGKTDGMADEIETTIDEEQPALLSHGEFVIPADVVSHLGNGNSEAGAEKLYEMMDRIRMARTGTKEQGKEINPDQFFAAAGGLAAAYAGGGQVQKFQTGGTPVATTTTAGGGVPLDTSKTSTLSPWVGDYVTNALGQGAALASAPYQTYQGPLTAGPSGLQQQAFAGASELTQAGYTPGQFTGGFGAQQAQQYMNPYIQASLDPQLRELKRQSDIARLDDASRLTKAGAYGGSRQAIMESEGRRNLLDKQQDVLGQGYKTAYDLGLGQFNKEREAEEASRQFGAGFGLKSIAQLGELGAQERGITSEGIAADRAQFEEQRDYAYKMPQYQLNLLQGLPIGASTSSSDQTGIAGLQSDIAGLASLYKRLEALGQTPATPKE